MNYALVGLVWGVIKYVLKEPIVNTALDNWTKGTSNQIDDWVWEMIEKAAGISEDKKEEAVVAAVAKLQEQYEYADMVGVVARMKEEPKAWNTATLALNGNYGNGAIA